MALSFRRRIHETLLIRIAVALPRSRALSRNYSAQSNKLHTKKKNACNSRSRSEIVTGVLLFEIFFAKLP